MIYSYLWAVSYTYTINVLSTCVYHLPYRGFTQFKIIKEGSGRLFKGECCTFTDATFGLNVVGKNGI